MAVELLLSHSRSAVAAKPALQRAGKQAQLPSVARLELCKH